MMIPIHKNIVLDEKQNPIAVQIPIEEFERLENLIEDYGLSRLIDETEKEEKLAVHEAIQYYYSEPK